MRRYDTTAGATVVAAAAVHYEQSVRMSKYIRDIVPSEVGPYPHASWLTSAAPPLPCSAPPCPWTTEGVATCMNTR